MEGEVRDILSEITAYVAMRYVTEESPESIKDEEVRPTSVLLAPLSSPFSAAL